jgi:predicted GTPase
MIRKTAWLLIVLLVSGPILVLAGAGAWFFWSHHGWLSWFWWAVLASWVVLAVLWRWYGRLHRPPPLPPSHWSPLDEQALPVIERHAERVDEILREKPEQLLSLDLYQKAALDLGRELAQHYHPGTPDAFDSLSLLEIVALIELTAHDVARLVETTVVGSHLLTVGRLRLAMRVADHYPTAMKVWTAVSAAVDLPRTAISYALSLVGSAPVQKLVQRDTRAYLYVLYVRRLGYYLIELYSGRLKGGARLYLRLKAAQAPGESAKDVPDLPDEKPLPGEGELKIAVVGQAKAGKSSLINALLGEQRAAADVLPATKGVTPYKLRLSGREDSLVLLDTPGYAHQGPEGDHLAETMEAVQQSALTLVVLHAQHAARDPDLQLFRQIDEWFRQRPHLRRPPLLGVLTHVDELRPRGEWSPPYNGWLQNEPDRPKERSIREAVRYVSGQFEPFLSGDVVPVCTDVTGGREYGVEEWLLPAMVNLFPLAEAKRLVDLLHGQADREGIVPLFNRLLETAGMLARLRTDLREATPMGAPAGAAPATSRTDGSGGGQGPGAASP